MAARRNIFLIVRCWKRACSLILLAALTLCAFSPRVSADERQYKVEAAYLYSFFNYITWPGYTSPQALQDPVICVYGNDPIVPYLNYIRSKRAAERAFTIVTFDDIEKATPNCNILFVRHRMADDISKALTAHTLIVLKPDDPLDRGGMVELSQDGERIAIQIDQAQLEKSGFQVSSRLLELAQVTR